jgi:hypothetical protein|tara:strand:+ start:309 stop:677 length:369 start_codon:yes stop_codon:yes gene_type:complete
MAIRVDIVQLSGNNFINIGTEDVKSLIVTNTDTETITLDVIIGASSLAGGTATTNAIHILKSVEITVGAAFIWEGDRVLDSVFKPKAILNKHNGSAFVAFTGQTYLIRVGSGHTADVIIKRK